MPWRSWPGCSFSGCDARQGRVAAWIATGLWLVSPFAIEIAQFCRFYALQSLAFFVGAWLVYAAALSTGPKRRVFLGVAALPWLGLALYLQPTTLIGFAGLGLWLLLALGLPWLRDRGIPGKRKALVLLGLVAGGLVLLTASWLLGVLPRIWGAYRSVPVFGQDEANDFWFYHARYVLLYPSLWPLVGVLGLAALARWPQPTGFALLVFGLGFLLNSFAAAKSMRYIAYAQIFLFVPWGLGIAVLLEPAMRFLARLGEGLKAAFPLVGEGLRRPLAWVLVAGALLFALAANPASIRSALLLADITIPPEVPRTNWPAAREALRPWLETADVVVTTEELGALYFLGRYDVRFSPSKLGELALDQRHEFGIDFRTGRPVITENASVERLVACLDKGLVVGPRHHLGMTILINPALEAFLREHTQRLDLPPASRLYAFGWDHQDGWTPTKDAGCEALPAFKVP